MAKVQEEGKSLEQMVAELRSLEELQSVIERARDGEFNEVIDSLLLPNTIRDRLPSNASALAPLLREVVASSVEGAAAAARDRLVSAYTDAKKRVKDARKAIKKATEDWGDE